MNLSELICPRAVVPELQALEKPAVIRELLQGLADAEQIPAGEVDSALAAVMKREELASTGIGRGLAVPHANTPLVEKLVGGIGICKNSAGIDWQSIDAEPVFVVILVLEPESSKLHLQMLEAVASRARTDNWLEQLRATQDVQGIVELL